MKARWWKRLWLRYLYYCKQHWIIAGALTAWAFWLVLQVAIQLLPVLLRLLGELLVALIAAVERASPSSTRYTWGPARGRLMAVISCFTDWAPTAI